MRSYSRPSFKSPGFFIVIDGPDAVGKTTQLDLVSQYLNVVSENMDFDVVVTRMPGGSTIGTDIRHLLLTDKTVNLTPITELGLIMSERAQHMDECIRPALNRGNVVLCDRYIDSTLAYQGNGRGIDKDLIMDLNDKFTDNLYPDLTIILTADQDTVDQRMDDRGQRDKLENNEMAMVTRQYFDDLKTLEKDNDRYVFIDANLGVMDVSRCIVDAIERRLYLEQ